ncbi:MAG: class I SAM-dependent methyltransferase [Pseudotabrizicola sp.]|uniref:class I SAM-dependent methyltransferase n=1 Tax=Pseudotabrizicola sp. TaxID=2939647 RepID=UPI00271743B2|nr:class I SAM-dependent methyltransferase [Pseudotabrizicola sp.]MDO8881526.1 class I SAM-dependent methyltransferase [Pseudotabrizicola sp.]MDP2080924.1 class I SAM-dependent methyltransferase [Pseudotabrizicola sp.]MDZ7572674.1 class I SAM-dependent methyltransferase [Pseudotabrizicola sp.]
MAQARQRRFWNKVADRYAARPLKDVAAYEAMLADVAARLKTSDKVLEIGCGTGGTAIRLAPNVAQWKATDFSTQMVRIAQAKPSSDKVSFTVSDAVQAFDDGPFDAVCAFNVLHLVDDLPATLARIHDNLTPGGQLICKTWCFADVALKLRLLFPLLRVIGLFPVANPLNGDQLRQAIRDAGFEIVADRVFGAHPQNPYIVARRLALA